MQRERVVLLMTTYAPDGPVGEATWHAAKNAMATWENHLARTVSYGLHVADDGSTLPGYGASIATVPCRWWNGAQMSFTRQERGGIGASLNRGLWSIFERSDMALFVMDDWRLMYDLDLAPWCDLLDNDENIGCVRMGPPHPGYGTVEMSPYGWIYRPARDGFAFSLRPALYHKRFFDCYGYFREGTDVGTVEEQYNAHYAATPGPDVVLALPSPFEWTYEIDGYPRPSLAGVVPGEHVLERFICDDGHTFDWPTTHPQAICPWIIGTSSTGSQLICSKAVARKVCE